MKNNNFIINRINIIRVVLIIFIICTMFSCQLFSQQQTGSTYKESDSQTNSDSQISTGDTSSVENNEGTSKGNTYAMSQALPQIADIVDKAKLGVATISTKFTLPGK